MSQLPYPLDPEVEAILQEVAKDPNSQLLRVDRRREVHDLATGEQAVSSRSANWSKAERHLLDCHREEVAFLLRYLYYVGFVNHERLAAWRDSQPKTAFRGIAQDADAIRRELRREGEHLKADFSEAQARNVIEQCLGVALDGGVSQMKLATASLRLVPSDTGRLYAGQEQLFSGDRTCCLETLEKLARQSPKAVVRSWASLHLGEALRQEGLYFRSLEVLRGIEEAQGPTPELLAWQLSAGLLLGDERQLTRILSAFEGIGMSASMAGKWGRHVAARSRTEGWRASASFREALMSCTNLAGPMTKVLLDELH